MANLKTKVKKYLEANSKAWDNTKVSLQNDSDGKGDYIKSWSYDGLAEPTNEQLETYEDAANAKQAELQAEYDAKQYQRDRLTEYPPIGDQLDMLWHSIDENAELKQKYFAFYEAIKAVKAKYPK